MSAAVAVRFNETVRDFLVANLPEGMPAELVIRAAQDTEPAERPMVVCRLEEGTTPHPALRQGVFVLELRTRTEAPATAADQEVLQRLVDVLVADPAGLAAALSDKGLRLRKFPQGGFGDELEDGGERRYWQQWGVWVEIRD